MFHVDVQGFANVIVRLIAGRNGSFLVAATLEDTEELVGEEVAGAQVEWELLPGRDEVDAEVIGSEVLCAGEVVIEDIVVSKRGVFVSHLLVRRDTKQFLEMHSNDVLEDGKATNGEKEGQELT